MPGTLDLQQLPARKSLLTLVLNVVIVTACRKSVMLRSSVKAKRFQRPGILRSGAFLVAPAPKVAH